MSAFSQSKMKIELLNNIFTDKLSDGLHNNEEIGVIKTGYGSLYYLISLLLLPVWHHFQTSASWQAYEYKHYLDYT